MRDPLEQPEPTTEKEEDGDVIDLFALGAVEYDPSVPEHQVG
jgi:hypothetical protein